MYAGFKEKAVDVVVLLLMKLTLTKLDVGKKLFNDVVWNIQRHIRDANCFKLISERSLMIACFEI